MMSSTLLNKTLAMVALITLAACDQNVEVPESAPADNNTASELDGLELKLGAFELALPAVTGRPAALYGTVTAGGNSDRLVAISIDGTSTELHETVADAGVMRMNEVEGFDMPAGAGVELKSGGKHGMVFGLPETVAAGDAVNGVLTFEKAGDIAFAAQVVARGNTDGMRMRNMDSEDSNSKDN